MPLKRSIVSVRVICVLFLLWLLREASLCDGAPFQRRIAPMSECDGRDGACQEMTDMAASQYRVFLVACFNV